MSARSRRRSGHRRRSSAREPARRRAGYTEMVQGVVDLPLRHLFHATEVQEGHGAVVMKDVVAGVRVGVEHGETDHASPAKWVNDSPHELRSS